MENKTTELVFVLDKSGSMSGLESDTIGGFNAMLQKQSKNSEEVVVTTVLFNDQYELLHDQIPINQLETMTEQDYEVGGMTALLDAIGFAIQTVCNRQRHSETLNKVLFVITTDGMENASREYDFNKIKEIIEQKKARSGWEFLFLGANIDAISTAESFGIHKDFAVNYHADRTGTQVNFDAINEAVESFRNDEKLDASWKRKIEEDFEQRPQ